MLEFSANTYLLDYQDGAYLCNGKKRVEAPLNLETLEEAVKGSSAQISVFATNGFG